MVVVGSVFVNVQLKGRSASSLPIAIAKRIIARTASMFRAQFLSSYSDFQPSWKEILLLWVSAYWSSSAPYAARCLHRHGNCLTVSLVRPQV